MDATCRPTEQCSAQCTLLTGQPLESGSVITKMQPPDASFFLRKRYLVCFLANLGMALLLILRSNLSIAIVDMTHERKVQFNNETVIQKAEFDWDAKMIGFILSVFSIGFSGGAVGGILGLQFGTATIFGIGVSLTGLMHILTPFLIRQNLWLFILARLLEGVFESFAVTCCAALFVHWAPPKERSRLVVFAIAGAHIGSAINYPLSGFLIQHLGWESSFYVPGFVTIIWSVIWFICVPNNPTTDRLMFKSERQLFKQYLSERPIRKKIRIPWRAMFTSIPFWAFMNEFFTYYWTQSFFSTGLPLFVKDSYDVSIQNIGIISGIPMVTATGGLVISGLLSDYLRNHTTFKKSTIHRIFVAIGQISFIICFVYCGVWANFEQSIISFTVTRLFAEASEMTYYVLTIDMFHELAALVKGFGVSVISVSFFANPVVMGFITSDHSRSSWNLFFLILSIFNVWGLIIFYLYGSGELQEWAAPHSEDETHKNESDDKNVE